jgi:hypothetical protein
MTKTLVGFDTKPWKSLHAAPQPRRQLFGSELSRAGLGPGQVVVYASPFSRALETARLAAEAAGVDAGSIRVSACTWAVPSKRRAGLIWVCWRVRMGRRRRALSRG